MARPRYPKKPCPFCGELKSNISQHMATIHDQPGGMRGLRKKQAQERAAKSTGGGKSVAVVQAAPRPAPRNNVNGKAATPFLGLDLLPVVVGVDKEGHRWLAERLD